MKAHIARWQIDYDADATRARYAQVAEGSQITCSCSDCRNFAAALQQAFPPAVRDILAQLGVDQSKPAEVYTTGEVASDHQQYAGWFHFVGGIVSGADAWRQVDKEGESFSGEFEPFGAHFQIGFTSRILLLPEPFESKPVVQLEFQTYVPWVLAERRSA